MKILKPLFLLLLVTGLAKAQTNYYGTDWQRDKLLNLVNDIISPVATGYNLSGVNMYEKKETAFYEFTNSDNNTITFELRRLLQGVDKDLGVKGKPIVDEISITGFLPDLYKIFKKMNQDALPLEDIKAKGSSPALVLSNKVVFGFYRSSYSNGYWIIRMRKN